MAVSFPAYREVRADARGRLWIKKYRRPSDPMVETWWVLDPLDHSVARMEFNRGIELLDAGPTYVLTLERDSLDVESVVGYRLYEK